MSWKPVFLGLCLLAVCLGTGAVAQDPPPLPEPKPTEELQSPLVVEPIVTRGAPIPDLPGATLLEVGQQYVLEGGAVAFWARVGKRDQDWALLGIRQGRLETIGADKGLARAQAVAGRTVLAVRPAAGFWAEEGTRVLASRDRLYIGESVECGTGLAGFAPPSMKGLGLAIWSWGPDGLKRVVAPGDSLSFGGKDRAISCAGLLAVSREGVVLMTARTADPEKRRGLAIRDGQGIRAVALEGLPLPGRPSAILRNSASEFPVFYRDAVLADDGGVLSRAYVEEGGKKRQGLWYLTPGSSKPLLQGKEPFAFLGGSPLRRMIPLAAQSADRYVAQVMVTAAALNYPADILVASDGAWFDTVDEWWLGEEAMAGAWYLSPSSPALFFILDFTVTETMPSSVWYKQFRGLALFDGQKVTGLLPGEEFVPAYARPVPADSGFSGYLVGGGWSVQGRSESRVWFLDALEPAKGLVDPPVAFSSGGLTVRLDQFLGWAAPGEALIHGVGTEPLGQGKEEGIYRVRGLE